MEIMVYCYADNNASIGAGIDTAEPTELKECFDMFHINSVLSSPSRLRTWR